MRNQISFLTVFTLIMLMCHAVYGISQIDISAEEWYRKGMSYFESKQYEKAIEAFSKTLELSVRFARAYINRGNAWSRKGEYDRAIIDYTKALEINLQ
ncbi:MAG: tetratricopeptide repeat protein, partial [Deltaproteobacteria bacterium]|nr:tetratricopeptide repeat protein [Deltaproteobacteria bacterium]